MAFNLFGIDYSINDSQSIDLNDGAKFATASINGDKLTIVFVAVKTINVDTNIATFANQTTIELSIAAGTGQFTKGSLAINLLTYTPSNVVPALVGGALVFNFDQKAELSRALKNFCAVNGLSNKYETIEFPDDSGIPIKTMVIDFSRVSFELRPDTSNTFMSRDIIQNIGTSSYIQFPQPLFIEKVILTPNSAFQVALTPQFKHYPIHPDVFSTRIIDDQSVLNNLIQYQFTLVNGSLYLEKGWFGKYIRLLGK